MVDPKVSKAAETANKSATSTPVGAEFAASRARRRARTCGELAAVGSLGANIVTTSTRTPNYRAPASGGTISEIAIESDAPAPDTDRDPPTSRTIEREEEPPPPCSALLVRLPDQALFLSLEDAPADINLNGREVVRAVRIEAHELDDYRERIVDALDDVAAHLVALLARST